MGLRYEDLTPAHHSVGLLWLEKMSRATFWNLSTKEAATLIGIEESKYIELTTKAHQGQAITLQSEAMEHLSLLLGLHKRLCLLCSNEGMA